MFAFVSIHYFTQKNGELPFVNYLLPIKLSLPCRTQMLIKAMSQLKQRVVWKWDMVIVSKQVFRCKSPSITDLATLFHSDCE